MAKREDMKRERRMMRNHVKLIFSVELLLKCDSVAMCCCFIT